MLTVTESMRTVVSATKVSFRWTERSEFASTPGAAKTGSEQRARHMPRPSWPWPDAVSMSPGR